MALPNISLGDQNGGAISTAIGWVAQALVGQAATSIAILALAILGFGMLWGRFDLHAAGRVALGAFILFGAPLIAYQMSVTLRGSGAATPSVLKQMPPLSVAPQMPRNAPAQDPYAGAAVPQLQ
ncbi:TrbC/VirB2 family protein [Sphingorhabdus sp.]|uniref:TrbC/VirB2 family protein n=1 Tax=Sphingorhabdus sp. TaxID=1902408 RepID=UPI0035933E7D